LLLPFSYITFGRLKIKKTMMASPAYHSLNRAFFFRPYSYFHFYTSKIVLNFLPPTVRGIRVIEKRREEKRTDQQYNSFYSQKTFPP
jgi:hypothetical protein